MSETDQRHEPHVSPGELRAALTPRKGARRNPVLVNEHEELAEQEIRQLREALESSEAGHVELRTQLEAIRRSIDASRADQIELRAALDAARGDAAELRAELATTKAESRERRNALEKLASAGFFKRRKVLADLSGRGVL